MRLVRFLKLAGRSLQCLKDKRARECRAAGTTSVLQRGSMIK